MLYLVDGNNLMGRKRSRYEALTLLAEFVRLKSTKVQVIFDGRPDPQYPEGSAYQGVQIRYSRKNSDADTRIKEIIATTPHPKELIVITSDSAILGTIRAYGAGHISIPEFLATLTTLRQAQAQKQPEIKPHVGGETKEWLRYFGYEPNDEEVG